MSSLQIQIPDELFAVAESSSYQGAFQIEKLTQGNDIYRFAEPLSWNVVITNTGGALLVGGKVAGLATTDCARCLEDAVYDLEGEVEGYFLLPGSNLELSEEEKDEYEQLGEDHIIDLEPLLIAALVLEMPYTPLCDDDCKGLCAQCGANRNLEPCDCDKVVDVDESNPFAVLKSLKFDK